MQLLARRFDTAQPVRVEIDGGRIDRIEPLAEREAAAAGLPWIAPGLIDLQVNGYGGQEFSAADLTVDKVAAVARAMDAFGIVRFCPTVTTNSREVLSHALGTIAAACGSLSEVARRVAGIHLEGPYITREDGARGAHPLSHCREPDWDEFQRLQEAAGGMIRILTLSVEFDGAAEFIRRVAQTGVIVSIGHTAATPEQIHAAADAGARMSTHLGNGSHPVLPRHRNYLWAQLADDRLTAGLIADGFHLPPDVVKCLIRAKSPERCVLVSDLSGLAGLAPGRYRTNLCEIEILESGKLVVAGQREILAAASAPIGVGVAHAMSFAGLTLAQAVDMATANPARMLGLPAPRLEPGGAADLVLFDLPEPPGPDSPAPFAVRATIQGGELVAD